jgi:hypothetical protein
MFVDWLKFSLIKKFMYEIDGWFQGQIPTNDALTVSNYDQTAMGLPPATSAVLILLVNKLW